MSYEGPKFTPIKINEEVPNDPRMDSLKYWCETFHGFELAPPYEGGSYGNLSYRLAKEQSPFIITASKSSLGDSEENDRFATVFGINPEGEVFCSGVRDPSSEAKVHLAIYEQRPDINAIFHGHCNRISLQSERLGIPITEQEEPYGTPELVDRVLDIVDEGNFLEMRNHGFISLGKTMSEAGGETLKMLMNSYSPSNSIKLKVLKPAASIFSLPFKSGKSIT